MVEFVNVSLGDEPVVSGFPATRVMCIIGKTVADVGVIREIEAGDLQSTLTGSNEGELASTDLLYLAAQDYFAERGSGGVVTLAGVSASGSLHENELLDQVSSAIWKTDYSPLDSDTVITHASDTPAGDRLAINNIEIMLNAAGTDEINANDNYSTEPEGEWYAIDHTLVEDNSTDDNEIAVELEDGIYTGRIEFTGDTISVTPDAVAVDVSVTNIVAIRASIRSTSLAETVKDLVAPGVQFDGFAFAYDATLEGDTAIDSKYAADQCVGGVGWLHDVILGAKLATQFNAAQQRAMFYFGLPEKVLPTDNISDEMAVGTAWNSTHDDYVASIKYDALRSVIGQNMYVAGFATKQTYGDSAIDPAIAAMAALARRAYRQPLTFATSVNIGVAIDDAPSSAEWKLWKQSRINAYVYTKSDDAWQWGSNLTFGASGNASNINFIRCKNRFAIDIHVILDTVVKRNLQYNISGYDTIRKALLAISRQDVGVYIDGVGTISIPNESLIRREGSLDEGEKAVLAALRATKTIDGISVTFVWGGDIEFINVTKITSE